MSKAKPRVEEKVEQLQALMEAAKTARPSLADEEQMAALAGELLTGTKAALTAGVNAVSRLPWSFAVKITSDTWPNLKPPARKQFAAALAALEGEDARRIRLSLGRGLITIDPPVCAQIFSAVAGAMLAANEGTLSNRDKQSFFNALIGKGKPWLHHVDVTGWEPAERLAFVECALQTAPLTAPFTQEALILWAQNLKLLDEVSEITKSTLAGGLRRWPGKLRKTWENPAEPLPEYLAAILREQPQQPEPNRVTVVSTPRQPRGQTPPPPAPEPVDEDGSKEWDEAEEAPFTPAADVEAATMLAERAQANLPAEPSPRNQPAPRPRQNAVVVETLKAQGRQNRQGERSERGERVQPQEFDLVATLRQIDQYVHGLRRELRDAKEQKEPHGSGGRGRGRGRDRDRDRVADGPAPSGPELEVLTAHNARLESTVAHLREQLEELKQDHEDRAATMEAGEPLAQFKTLLSLKLKEDFAEFHALRGQSANDVIRQHYGDLLRHVFEVLTAEGVPLEATPTLT